MNQDKETPIQESEETVKAAEEQRRDAEPNEADARRTENPEAAEPEADPDSGGTSIEAEEEIQSDRSDRELEKLRQLADENYQRYLRAQADFDNFRRRARLEKEEFAKYASMELLGQLLPVVDNLERALQSARTSNDAEALRKGVEMIAKQFLQVLEKEGLRPIEAVGQTFNPDCHEAIMQVESDEHEQGTVVEEVQKGYVLKDKVLRPAMVKVSS